MQNAVRLVQAGAHMVKVEGGGWTTPIVRFLVQRGIPVCAHRVSRRNPFTWLGGFRIQGREEAAVATMRGPGQGTRCGRCGDCIVLELMPAAVARAGDPGAVRAEIGIGAGSGCSGQVLVLHDMLNDGRQTAALCAQFPRAEPWH